MVRTILAALLIASLALSACQEKKVIPTPILDVQEQAAEGGTVVFQAAIDGPGWLVLHPTTPAGEPDASSEIARAYLPKAGEYARITMSVGDAVVGDADVVARLYYDDPADQAFTFSPGGEEDPLVFVDDSTVTVSFTVRGVTPHIEVDDTSALQGTVVIKVVIDKPGWLVLRPPTAEGKPDTLTLLSSTYLAAAGVYPGFEVTLPVDVARSYFAVLHYDDPADGEFSYPKFTRNLSVSGRLLRDSGSEGVKA